MAVVLGIRPPKMAYIDNSNGSPCLWAGGGGGGHVCIILPTHLFLHTAYLAKSFKFCINFVYVSKQIYGIHKFACLWYCFVHLLFCMPVIYTLNKSSKWYIVYICRVFLKGLSADKFCPYYDLKRKIKTNNFVFVHFKSSCQYQFTSKTVTAKAKWRLKPK